MLFSTSSSYTLPKLFVEDRCQTPSLLGPDILSARDQQIRLYCQTLASLVLGLHSNSQNAVIRLQRRTQRILDIETRIDLNMDDAQKHFERNLQLFVCMVDHRLRSLAVESPDRYLFIADKLQLILIEAGSTTPQRTFKVQFLKKAFKKLLHVT